MDITRLQSMAQIHSYYITNAKSELNFSSSNLGEEELEIALQEITEAMINNDDLFVDNEDNEDIFSDDENTNSNEEDVNDLIMANIMNLDNFKEQNEDDVDLNIRIQPQSDEPVIHRISNIDFEAILDEKLEEE